MNGIVIILVLGAALSHALWNLLLKQTENRLMMMMSMLCRTSYLDVTKNVKVIYQNASTILAVRIRQVLKIISLSIDIN